MSRPGFWREAGGALVLSGVGAVAYHVSAAMIGSAAALRLVILVLGLAYALWSLHGLNARVGRVLAVVAWIALDVALCVFDPPLLLWMLAHAFAIWLLRCWCRYGSPAAALADGALNLFATAAAIVAASHSHSVFLALWTFFLVQAVFVLIPATLQPRAVPAQSGDVDRFDHAHRSAAAALQRLTSRSSRRAS